LLLGAGFDVEARAYVESGSAVTQYYAGVDGVVAVRHDGELYWRISDHLGSTSVTAQSDGTLHSEVRYGPWGTDRYVSGETPTTMRYTGQRQEVGIGLYYYNARWYDPQLGRFVQVDYAKALGFYVP